jgi:hypothetical protein
MSQLSQKQNTTWNDKAKCYKESELDNEPHSWVCIRQHPTYIDLMHQYYILCQQTSILYSFTPQIQQRTEFQIYCGTITFKIYCE